MNQTKSEEVQTEPSAQTPMIASQSMELQSDELDDTPEASIPLTPQSMDDHNEQSEAIQKEPSTSITPESMEQRVVSDLSPQSDDIDTEAPEFLNPMPPQFIERIDRVPPAPVLSEMMIFPRKRKRKNKNKKRRERQYSGQFYGSSFSTLTTIARRNIVVPRRILLPHSVDQTAEVPIERIMDGKEITEINIATIQQELWVKKRCLKLPGEHIAIPRCFFFGPTWIGVELRDRKHELNKTKSLLDNYPLDTWHQHTKRIYTSGLVMPTLKADIRPEYCSQAWCKMFECFSNFPLIPKNIVNSACQKNYHPRFLSVHLCEAPGAFISATNHYIYTKYPQIHWSWLATTLNPYYEGNDVGNMINEDKLILSSINNWIFLEDSTGNIMNQDNLNSLIDQVQKRSRSFGQPVNLVTADGSIDCQNNPMEQESTVVELQFAEIVAALSILGVGGSFVLKIFTFLECQTINHLYILCSLFKEVHLYKPATSKEGNSEVYVICLEYFGRIYFKQQLEILKQQVGVKFPMARRFTLVSKKLTFCDPFIGRILRAALFFTGYQMAIIKRNIATYEDRDAKYLAYYQHDIIKRDVASAWKTRYGLKMLPREQLLFGFNNYRNRCRQIITHVDPRTEIGSYTDKLRLHQSNNLLLKMSEIEKQVGFYNTLDQELWFISEITGHCSKLTPITGRPYSDILSSRFCFGKILSIRHDLRKAVQPFSSSIIWNDWGNVSTFPCNSCNPTSVYFHFSQSLPDIEKSVEQWQFTCLCCKSSVNHILKYSDVEIMQKCFREVLLKISDLQLGQSLFLCTYPLLSRLQLGFIHALAVVFEKVILGTGGGRDKSSTHPRGILLHRFLGIYSQQEQDLIMDLSQIVTGMTKFQKTDGTDSVLEIVPIKNLIELQNFNDILKYNLLNTASELSLIIRAAKKAIKLQPQLGNYSIP